MKMPEDQKREHCYSPWRLISYPDIEGFQGIFTSESWYPQGLKKNPELRAAWRQFKKIISHLSSETSSLFLEIFSTKIRENRGQSTV